MASRGCRCFRWKHNVLHGSTMCFLEAHTLYPPVPGRVRIPGQTEEAQRAHGLFRFLFSIGIKKEGFRGIYIENLWMPVACKALVVDVFEEKLPVLVTYLLEIAGKMFL